ncbi:MAG: dTMP kinase [Candidatus Saccharibacteria bacterium]|nr:dTMP kinase [Candidatus Saccharibacteria bacterium]
MVGRYIVIEGQDATGKDTQAKLLVEYLKSKGEKVVTYSESGTSSENEFVKTIAKLNYGSDQNLEPRTHALLYLINRYEQWKKIAEPALSRGETVITTRNWFSTLIYTGYASGVSRSLITKLHKEVMPENYFHPDNIVIFTISPEEQVKRLGTQERAAEFWKSKGGEFQQKLNAGYLQVAKDFNVPTLDASGTIEEIQADLRKLFGL